MKPRDPSCPQRRVPVRWGPERTGAAPGKGEAPSQRDKGRSRLLAPPARGPRDSPCPGRAVPVLAGLTPLSGGGLRGERRAAPPPLAARGQRRTGERAARRGGGGAAPGSGRQPGERREARRRRRNGLKSSGLRRYFCRQGCWKGGPCGRGSARAHRARGRKV